MARKLKLNVKAVTDESQFGATRCSAVTTTSEGCSGCSEKPEAPTDRGTLYSGFLPANEEAVDPKEAAAA